MQPANDDALPRCLKRKDVDIQYGIKPATFSRLVARGTMPKPLPGTRLWDRVAIDQALARIGGVTPVAANDNETEADRWFRENCRAGTA
jgi:hypothetical protein